MTGARPPIVVVVGASADDPPPGIERATGIADLRFAREADGLPDALGEADAVFAWGAQGARLEAAWPSAMRLRWIQSASDGVDGLLFPALVASDITVTNARGVFDAPIAEWVIAAILAFETGLRTSIVDTVARRWNGARSRGQVAGRRLVVVGPGPVGRATATRARRLGMDVVAVGRSERDDPDFGRISGPDALLEVLAQADHVVDALPLTGDTVGYFDARAFDAMPATAHFYNVGRGATVVEADLVAALHEGRLAGAALDVFHEEPLDPGSPLWKLPNVIVSPHVCGDVDGWERTVVDVFIDNLHRFAEGEPLRNRVDKTAGFGLG